MKFKTTSISISLFAGLITTIVSYIFLASIFAQASTTIINIEPLAPWFALLMGLVVTGTVATLLNLKELSL
jgi:hypothetical protein